MEPTTEDFKQLLTEIIKKQIIVFGPSISLAKARSINGLTVLDDGTVTQAIGTTEQLANDLIDQFNQLSSSVVKKTIEPFLASYGHAKKTKPY